MINEGKYSFKDYSEKYPKLFYSEKSKIRKILPIEQIEHIGSSSVKGLGGKGIIDIGIFVPKKDLEKTIEKLKLIGYEYVNSEKDNERKFLQKIIKDDGKERRIHIQLITKDSSSHQAVLAVRDYLRKNIKACNEYTLIKKREVKYAKGEGEKYREFKKDFLDKLEKEAIKDYDKTAE